MNKLELLYKMSKEMKSKEKINGTVKIVGIDGNKEFANLTNNFVKDVVNETMSIDANIFVEVADVKVEKSVKKTFSAEDMKKHHEGHAKHHEGHKCGKNKFGKLEMMFKTLYDLSLTEGQEDYILELDIKEILEKKKAKFEAMKLEGKHKECCANKIEDTDLKEVFKAKHMMMKEMINSNIKDAKLMLVVSKDFTIKEVDIALSGDKKLNVEVKLNY